MSTADMTRDDIRQLLPFHANGSLDAAEGAQVRDAVAADAGLRRELDTLIGLRDAIQADDEDFSPGEFGLARLHRAMDAEANQNRQSGDSRLHRFVGIAAVVALIAVSVTALMQNRELDYIQASGEAPTDQIGGFDAARVLTVAFGDAALQADVTALLTEFSLVVVDGPSALGLYRLGVPEGADIEALAQRLQDSSAVDLVTLP